MNTLFDIIAVGVIATIILDLWLVFLQGRVLGAPFTGFNTVGRWVSYFPQGRFVHDDISKVAPAPHEMILGWIVHYLVGILFAAILIITFGAAWLTHPSLIPALLVGVFSLIAPFCIMQPAFGLGFAASKTPKPWTARLRSFTGHTVFGLGLYIGGIVVSSL